MRMFALCPSISALGYCLSMAKSRKTQPAFSGRLLFCQQLPTLSYQGFYAMLLLALFLEQKLGRLLLLPLGQLFYGPNSIDLQNRECRESRLSMQDEEESS